MKVGTALLFVCIGIYITYNHPQFALVVYGYIQLALQWIIATFNQLSVASGAS